MSDVKANAEALVPKFKFERQLNQDQAGRRTTLLGTIDSSPALLILERAPFPTSTDYLSSAPLTLRTLKNLGANDIYHWYMASSGTGSGGSSSSSTNSNDPSKDNDDDDNDNEQADDFSDLKINLIYPCTSKHIAKYSRQLVRYVTETPALYQSHVRPYMQAQREAGRLNWVFNIIEGRKEVEDVIYRTPFGEDADDEGFLLLPDLNWDRKTVDALHLLGLVERRDLWSLRDLKKKHVPFLRHMKRKFVEATTQVYYPDIEEDQLKLYVHYQPTYYHFHIHIVHVQLEAGATQAVGKAVGLDSIIETLEVMEGDGEAGMEKLTMCYTLGEESDLWKDVFGPLKKKEKEQQQQQQQQQLQLQQQ